MLRRSYSTRWHDSICYIAYALLLMRAFLYTTTFTQIIPGYITEMMRYIAYFLFIYRVAIFRKVKCKLFIIGIIMAVVSALSWISSGYTTLLDFSVACICSVDADYSKVIKTYVVIVLFLTAITILAALSGIINNYIYFRNGTSIRMSMGFVYPTDFAAHVFFVMAAIAYLLYERFSFLYVVFYTLIAYIEYKITNARGPCGMIIVLAIIVYLYRASSERKIKLLPTCLLQYSSVISAIITLGVISCYNAYDPFWQEIDRFMTRRLSYADIIRQTNRVKLFGQYIQQKGDGKGGRALGVAYTYIDLSFQRILLMYGVVFFVFILVYTVLLNTKAIRSNNMRIPLLLFVISFYSLTAQHFFDFSYNFILLAYFTNISIDIIKTREAQKSQKMIRIPRMQTIRLKVK